MLRRHGGVRQWRLVVASRPAAAGSPSHRAVRAAAGAQRALDLALLSMSPRVGCIRGDPRSLDPSTAHTLDVLARASPCGRTPTAVPGLGDLCGSIDLCRLASESRGAVGKDVGSALPNPRMQPTGRSGRRSARARASQQPGSGSVDLCGRGPEGLQLMCQSLGGPRFGSASYVSTGTGDPS
jgi:hypothetical protein